MGQHKTNPTAIKAANGEISPKQSKISKAECGRLLYSICNKILSFSFMECAEEIEVEEKRIKESENYGHNN